MSITEQIVTNRQDPNIEAYRLGLLGDVQGFTQNQIFGQSVQNLRAQGFTDEEIAAQLSTAQRGVEGDADFRAAVTRTPEQVAAISDDIMFAPPDYQVAGLSAGEQAGIAGAQLGVGAYQPFLTSGAQTLQGATGAIADSALPFLQQGAAALAGADATFTPLGGTYRSPFESTAAGFAEQGAGFADTGAAGISAATGLGTSAAQRGMAGADLAAERARGSTAAAQQALGAAGQLGTAGADIAAERARASTAAAQQALGAAGQAGIAGADLASTRARATTGAAQEALAAAGQYGIGQAQQGIEQLAGTTGTFDPSGIASFMSEYDDAAVQQALADVARAGQLQQAQLGADAVAAGAFGGSRQGVAQGEIARNVLEQQGRTAAQMRQAGFESAANRAQQAFEQAAGRTQQAAQLQGQLGQAGAGTALTAAQQAAALGLSTEQLAQAGALQGAQLGTQAAQQAGALGLSAEQLAQTGALQGAQLGAQTAQQAGALGLSAEQLAQAGALQGSGLGLTAAQQAAANAGAFGQLGLAGADLRMKGAAQQEQSFQQAQQAAARDFEAARARQLQGAGLLGTLGQGIGGLGAQLGQLGIQQAGLGEMRTALGTQDLQNLLTTGATERGIAQAGLDAQRLSNLQAYSQPFQQYGFLSDIYSGIPTGSSTITASSAPQVSPFQSALGLGIAGLSAAGGASRAGLF